MKYNRTRVGGSAKTSDALYYTSVEESISQRYSIYVSGLGPFRREPKPFQAILRDPTKLKGDLTVSLVGAPGIGVDNDPSYTQFYYVADWERFKVHLTSIAMDFYHAIFEATAKPESSFIPQTKLTSRSISDVVTKGFKRKSLKGEIVNNPMEKHSIEVEVPLVDGSGWIENIETDGVYTEGSYTNYNGLYYITLVGVVAPSFPLCSTQIMSEIRMAVESSQNEARANPQNAVNSAYGNIDVGSIQALVTAGEGRETLALIQQTISRFIKIARAFKSGNWASIAPKTLKRYQHASRSQKAVKLADFSQDAWMEARYAWRPLIGEVQAAFDLLNGKRSLSPRQTFRGSDSDKKSSSYSSTFRAHGTTYTIEYDSVDTQYCRAGVLCQAHVTDLVNELSLTNLVDAAIELTPFSFVLQWFINIGGLLYHLRPSGGYSVQAAWVTTVTTSDVTGTISYVQADGSTVSNTFSATKTHYLREPGGTPTLFSIDLNLDLTKLVDLIAILRNLSR